MNSRKESKYCILCCKRYLIKEVRFHKVPQCDLKRQRWVENCGIDISPKDFVCEKHFTAKDFYGTQKRMLMPGAIPLLFVVEPGTTEYDPLDFRKVDSASQTDDDAGCSYRMEIYCLKRELEILKAEHAKTLLENSRLVRSLSSFLSKDKVEKLINKNKKKSRKKQLKSN